VAYVAVVFSRVVFQIVAVAMKNMAMMLPSGALLQLILREPGARTWHALERITWLCIVQVQAGFILHRRVASWQPLDVTLEEVLFCCA
jgi:hypothetical protein